MNFSQNQDETLVFQGENFSLFLQKDETFKRFPSKNCEIFKQEREFFEDLGKEPHLPSIFPRLRSSEEKAGKSEEFLVFCEEISCSFTDFLRKQPKILPFRAIFGFFKAILRGFCFLRASKRDVSSIKIGDFFLTREKELKLLSFRSGSLENACKYRETVNFCEILLEIFTRNSSKSDISSEIDKIEAISEELLLKSAHDRENLKKLLRFLKKVLINRDETCDLLEIFSETLSFPSGKALKNMILLEEGE